MPNLRDSIKSLRSLVQSTRPPSHQLRYPPDRSLQETRPITPEDHSLSDDDSEDTPEGVLALTRTFVASQTEATAGVSAGFDMLPRLSRTDKKDAKDWQNFIQAILYEYQFDSAVYVEGSDVVFKIDMDDDDDLYNSFQCSERHVQTAKVETIDQKEQDDLLRLPLEGWKFARFSAQITGRVEECLNRKEGVDGDVMRYLKTVSEIAVSIFDDRIKRWGDGFEKSGLYS
jgi:hypothetical protein